MVGVDVAAAMVQLAGSLYPGIDFQAADAEALPFEDGSFDAVVSNFIVPHLGRPERAVGELARVLEIGGAPCAHHMGPTGADASSRTDPGSLRNGRGYTASGHSARPTVLPVFR